MCNYRCLLLVAMRVAVMLRPLAPVNECKCVNVAWKGHGAIEGGFGTQALKGRRGIRPGCGWWQQAAPTRLVLKIGR